MKVTQVGLYRVRNGNVAMVYIILTGNPDIGLPVVGKMFQPIDGMVEEVDMAWNEYGEGTDENLDLIKFMPNFVIDPPKTSRSNYLKKPYVPKVNEQFWEKVRTNKEASKLAFVPVVDIEQHPANLSLGETEGNFYKASGPMWLVRTVTHGNYQWSNPDYGGDNTMEPTGMEIREWCNSQQVDTAKYMGKKIIGTYCGNFKLV